MGFSECRKLTAAVEHSAADADELRDIPPHLDESPSPRPGDAAYIHSVFYDRHKFETFPETLLQEVREGFPQQPHWRPEPVHAASLHGRMAKYSWSHTKKFLQFGYVAELEPPVFGSAQSPKRSLRSEEAWNAFLANAAFAEGIADALLKCRATYRLDWIFRYPHTDALAPIIGKIDDTYRKTRKDTEPGTTILCSQGALLVAPRTILNGRRNGSPAVAAYPADPVALRTASTKGRAQYSDWTSDARKEILSRLKQEIRAWCEAGFNPEAFLLWTLQTVAILRVQATDWKGRERRSYVLGDADAKRQDVEAELQLKLTESGLDPDDDCPIEVRRAPLTARADVISRLAGGIGLEDEAIWRDDDVHRANFARQILGGLAEWIGRLKRFHQETLTPEYARLIEEILTDTPGMLEELEMTLDDQSGPRLVRAQFPDDVWQVLVDAALYSERGEMDVEVDYNWNDDPLRPAAILSINEDGNNAKVIIAGPLLDLSATRRAWWQAQLEEFRQIGSLTI